MKQSVLLAGESWVSTSTHIKGFDQFDSVTAHNGARRLLAAMADSDYQITQMCADQAQTDFPATVEALSQYQAVILSDIGANTLLLHRTPGCVASVHPTGSKPFASTFCRAAH